MTELLQVPLTSLHTASNSSTSTTAIPKSSSHSSFNQDTSTSSTDDEDSDERLYGSMMMASSLVSEPSILIDTHEQVDTALNFLTNISLTGAPDSNAPRDASRFVAVSAADFLCNISLTGPMNLPVPRQIRRRSKAPRVRHSHHHHNHHHNHHQQKQKQPHPLRLRQVSTMMNDIVPEIRFDAAVDDDDHDDPDFGIAVSENRPLTSRGAPLAQTAFDDVVAAGDASAISAVPDIGVAAPAQSASASLPNNGSRTHRILADSAPNVAPAEVLLAESIAVLATADAMSAAYVAATAAATASEHDNDVELRRAADAIPMANEADEFFRGGSARRVAAPRRLATSLPADVAGVPDAPKLVVTRTTGTGGGMPLTPAERIARYRNAKVPVAVSSTPSSFGSAPPMASTPAPPVPVAPKPRAAPRVMNIGQFQDHCKGQSAPQRVYLCAAGKNAAPPTMLAMCTYLPFVHSRRRVAAGGDAVGAMAAGGADVSGGPSRKKRATSGGQSFGTLLQPSWLRPPALTCGGEDQAGVPAVYCWSYLDDPALATGKHRVVMQLCGMSSTVLPYVRPKVLKAELDTAFARRHPWLSIKLTQLRKVKKLMLHVMSMGDLELSTLALAYVYLDKLLLRKFCSSKHVLLVAAGATLTLATKFNESIAMDKTSYRKLMGTIKHVMAVDVREVHALELRVWVALDMHLFVPSSEPLQHLPAIRMANVDEKFIPVNESQTRKKQARLAALSRPNTIFKVI